MNWDETEPFFLARFAVSSGFIELTNRLTILYFDWVWINLGNK